MILIISFIVFDTYNIGQHRPHSSDLPHGGQSGLKLPTLEPCGAGALRPCVFISERALLSPKPHGGDLGLKLLVWVFGDKIIGSSGSKPQGGEMGLNSAAVLLFVSAGSAQEGE